MKRIFAVVLCLALVMTMGAGTAFAGSGLLIAPRPASGLTIEVPNFEGGKIEVQGGGSGLVGSNFFFVPATVKYGGEVVTDYEIMQDGEPYFAVDLWEDGRFYLKPLKAASRVPFKIRYNGTDYEFTATISKSYVRDQKEHEYGMVDLQVGERGAYLASMPYGSSDQVGSIFFGTPLTVRFNGIRCAGYEVIFEEEGYFAVEYLEDGRVMLTPLKPGGNLKFAVRYYGNDYRYRASILSEDLPDYVPLSEEEREAAMKEAVKNLKLKATSDVRTENGKRMVRVIAEADVYDILNAGYDVEYAFYRSTKKSSGFGKAKQVSDKLAYFDKSGKKGTKYYYKAVVLVKDDAGKTVAKTALKQCKYASRTWK